MSAPVVAAPVVAPPKAPAEAAPPPIDTTPVADSAISVAVAPVPAYLERTDSAQLVNCDLRVRNTSKATFELTELQVSAFDAKGALVFRKLVSGNGVSPSIQTIPNRTLGAEQELLILNPLHAFPLGLELARLAFELTYERSGTKQTIVAKADALPREFTGKAALALPVRERVLVWSGHDFLSHHRRWDYVFAPIRELGFTSNAGRYSYDLVVVDAAGEMVTGDRSRNESWFGFGKPLHAPAAGTVVAVVGDRPDDRKFEIADLATNLFAVYGNYLVIEHAAGEYSVLAHLKQHSPKVRVGDAVKAGQEVAAIGASGSSLMPHLHYQLQSTGTGAAEGLPSYFHDFSRVRGARRVKVKRGAIETGEILKSY
jgi:hypothetical protein